MSIADGFIMELEQESAATRRVMDRLPEDKLSWKPHPKSMSLGQLAMHVAQVPGSVSNLLSADITAPPGDGSQAEAKSRAEVLDAMTASINDGKARLKGWDDSQMMATWTFSMNGKTIMSAPRVGMVRMIMFNHLYHHRGQLQVYLRLLGVPVPSVYGPTADENPFM
jgi:uncharacterized damage-inducible protein DinB